MSAQEEELKVRVLVSLDLETVPPQSTKGGKLALDILEGKKNNHKIQIPGGWLLPIQDIMKDLDAFSDLILYQTHYHHEFEIGGGIEIITMEGISLGVPTGATFNLALKMCKMIPNLPENGIPHRIFLSSQDYWDVSRISGCVVINTGKIAVHEFRNFRFDARELAPKLTTCCSEIIQFEKEIEPYLVKRENYEITEEMVRNFFGME